MDFLEGQMASPRRLQEIAILDGEVFRRLAESSLV